MARLPATIERMERGVGQFVQCFGRCIDVFDRAALFTGPSLYFHLKAIDLCRQIAPLETVQSRLFLEGVYWRIALG